MKCRGGLGTDNARSTPSLAGPASPSNSQANCTRKTDAGRDSRSAVRSLRLGVKSAGNSPATSPVISRQVLSSKAPKAKSKTLKADSPTVNPDTSLVDITSTPEPFSTPPAPIGSDGCPCGVSNRSEVYKIDCSQCKRFWHQDCLTMGGLPPAAINKMVDYLCPWCYVPPVPNPNPSPNVCFTCKNTDTLRNLALWREIQAISDKFAAFQKLDTELSKVNDGLSERVSVFQDFDLHLQHLLINKDKLDSYQDSIKTIEKDIQTLSQNLATQTDLLKTQAPSKPPDFGKLEDLCEKLYSQALIGTPCAPTSPIPSTSASPRPALRKADATLKHSEKPVADSKSGFLDTEILEPLLIFLQDQKKKGKFASEKGHSVLLVGKDYHYTGARSKGTPAPIPGPIADVVKHIYSKFDGNYELNSVLVNHYPAGSTSYLPEHSDNEVSINPDSHIYTLSLGGSRTLSFRDMSTKVNVVDHVCEHNSLYLMSRHSQNFFSHRIDKSDNAEDPAERFSLTFRCIDQRYRRSTIVLGDSNTKMFRFGEGAGTFGRGLPGRRQPTMKIEDINPADCISYNNAVVQCGINDLTSSTVTIAGPKDVALVFDQFKHKIDRIIELNPKVNVFIVPLLPTRSVTFNKSVRVFNNLIQSKIIECNYRCMVIDDIKELSYSDGLLRSECMREEWDNIHVNIRCVRKIALSIRNAIYLKYNSGRKSRVVSSTKTYSEAASTKPRGGGRRSNS